MTTWTGDDLPDRSSHELREAFKIRFEGYTGEDAMERAFIRGAAYAERQFLNHLNTHYPKPSDDLHSTVLSQAGHVHDLKADLADMTRERDAAVARAEAAEQLIPAYAMLDVWGALGRDSIHFDDWYDEHGYADAWAELAAAVREAAETHDDPAVYVVRESNVAAVEVERRGGKWVANGEAVASVGDGPARVRRPIALYLEWAVMAEAVARAIEAEQAADPVEAKAQELYEHVYTGRFKDGSSGVQAEYRKLAAYVLGQEASSDE